MAQAISTLHRKASAFLINKSKLSVHSEIVQGSRVSHTKDQRNPPQCKKMGEVQLL